MDLKKRTRTDSNHDWKEKGERVKSVPVQENDKRKDTKNDETDRKVKAARASTKAG